MDSTELGKLKRRARMKYEWGRARRAIFGFAPAVLIVILAMLLGSRPVSILVFGGIMLALGVVFLWYGRDVRRGVLPGIVAGSAPFMLAMCANHLGHACTDDGCMMLCVPACAVGGLVAGLAIVGVGHHRQYSIGFWVSASCLALLTGAMGCMCVGYSGVIGLGIGFGTGLIPFLAQRLSGIRSE